MNEVLSRLENLKKLKNLRTVDVCDQTHIRASTYATWLSNDRIPDVAALRKLSDFYDVSVDYLVNGSDFTKGDLTEEQINFVYLYDSLDSDGKERLRDYAEFLATKYIKNSNSEAV